MQPLTFISSAVNPQIVWSLSAISWGSRRDHACHSLPASNTTSMWEREREKTNSKNWEKHQSTLNFAYGFEWQVATNQNQKRNQSSMWGKEILPTSYLLSYPHSMYVRLKEWTQEVNAVHWFNFIYVTLFPDNKKNGR